MTQCRPRQNVEFDFRQFDMCVTDERQSQNDVTTVTIPYYHVDVAHKYSVVVRQLFDKVERASDSRLSTEERLKRDIAKSRSRQSRMRHCRRYSTLSNACRIRLCRQCVPALTVAVIRWSKPYHGHNRTVSVSIPSLTVRPTAVVSHSQLVTVMNAVRHAVSQTPLSCCIATQQIGDCGVWV